MPAAPHGTALDHARRATSFHPSGGGCCQKRSSAAGWTLLALTPTCVAWALRADVPKEYIKHAKDCDAAVPGSVGDVQHVRVRAVRKRVRDEIDRPRSLHSSEAAWQGFGPTRPTVECMLQ